MFCRGTKLLLPNKPTSVIHKWNAVVHISLNGSAKHPTHPHPPPFMTQLHPSPSSSLFFHCSQPRNYCAQAVGLMLPEIHIPWHNWAQCLPRPRLFIASLNAQTLTAHSPVCVTQVVSPLCDKSLSQTAVSVRVHHIIWVDCFRLGFETCSALYFLQPVLMRKVLCSMCCLLHFCWTIIFPVVWCSLPICPSCSDEIWQSNSVLGWYCIRYQSTLNMPASVLMVLLKYCHRGLSCSVSWLWSFEEALSSSGDWGDFPLKCLKVFLLPLMHWLIATCIYRAPQLSLGFHQSSPRLYCFDPWIPSN